MYALKLRKKDLPLLTILNDGVAPEIPTKGVFYLLVTPGESSRVIDEKELDDKFMKRLSSDSPLVFKFNKK